MHSNLLNNAIVIGSKKGHLSLIYYVKDNGKKVEEEGEKYVSVIKKLSSHNHLNEGSITVLEWVSYSLFYSCYYFYYKSKANFTSGFVVVGSSSGLITIWMDLAEIVSDMNIRPTAFKSKQLKG